MDKKFKKVYSEIPACSQVGSSDMCQHCDSQYMGSRMKLFVDAETPIPVRAEIAEDGVTCKVTYDADVKEENVRIYHGKQLAVKSKDVQGAVVTVVVEGTEYSKAGVHPLSVEYAGIKRMFRIKVTELTEPSDDGVHVTGIVVDPKAIEAGKKASVKIALSKPETKKKEQKPAVVVPPAKEESEVTVPKKPVPEEKHEK